MIKLASSKECTGCMACVDSCPHNVIMPVIKKDGHRYPEIDHLQCVSCGRCQKVCPVINHFDYCSDSKYKPLLAWAKDDNIRLRSTSGGIFAALATYVLKNGGLVCGCIMDGLRAKHIIIDSYDELSKLQGSKYLHSEMTGIYKAIKKELQRGDRMVLYSGTRCLVAGLLSYLGKSYDNLITLDLVCSGVPSSLLTKFHEGRYSTIASFRDKEKGWDVGIHSTLVDKNGNKCKNTEDSSIIDELKVSVLTIRSSCLDCKFATPHSKADLTTMDYWGEKEHKEEHFKGVSCVIPNTEKGKKILEQSDVNTITSEWSKCLPYNPRIAYGKYFGAKFNLFRVFMPFLFNHCSKRIIQLLYVDKLSWKTSLMIPMKLYKYGMWKIMIIHTERSINKILEKGL
ncbi:MAG: Coenzyme F420 hydrogenase/dehydrogenase, beta subunit C-terminal domain [Prevotella sp.]|uniref:4Fe-4S dicluster domain-containing protein n=1 Tax=Prevotella sp. TaxID=59823 RepID=UPI002A3061E5|nr:Coenzyme F420 hydrogenase/dehydrogenase, beta subunit C-terminal domain [Prevotella sp.]MDD7317917.1 Coenzyme F420 hydrogenase/dehydrogenase, beta subunit C-terminal domain [Prevotellaceae bacterium]MDY4020808.1 Coenzyme F420 hydrogenase/dehydrogenase, beta subunit C-terminal domain [Prevotella sp.]